MQPLRAGYRLPTALATAGRLRLPPKSQQTALLGLIWWFSPSFVPFTIDRRWVNLRISRQHSYHEMFHPSRDQDENSLHRLSAEQYGTNGKTHNRICINEKTVFRHWPFGRHQLRSRPRNRRVQSVRSIATYHLFYRPTAQRLDATAP